MNMFAPSFALPARHAWRAMCTAVVAASLVACGGGGGDAPASPPGPGGGAEVVPPPVAQRSGQLVAATPLARIASADVALALQAEDAVAKDVLPRYSVSSYRLDYYTTDADGREVLASGLVSVPDKAAGARSPVLSYQHGSIFRDAEAPSNNVVASEVTVVLASLGYIVLAPDYVGFGTSKGVPHPYLQAEPAAAATVDFLTAARSWRSQANVLDNDQLFLTGYSEGGYTTMAAHRALQTSGSPHLAQLRLVVPGAGPYDVQATMDGLVRLVRDENKVLGALINPGFLRHLGGSVQREVRRLLLRALLPGDADVVYDARFIDRFLADDTGYLAEYSSVHDWTPKLPVPMFHGRDDRTVPYASSASAARAMRERGADGVSLTDCKAEPAGHLECVGPFFNFLLDQLQPVARDL